MAFDGSGIFLRLRNWVADATAGVKIRADFHDTEDDNFAGGLSQCIVKDGQTTITQNIPFNSKRITALADPVDPQDAATKHYADTKMPLDGSAPITGDVIIRNDDPSLTLDGKPGFNDVIYGDKNSKHRWALVLGNAVPETGSDVGSEFELISYHDDGTVIGDALTGIRATGLLSVKANPTAALGIVPKQYADTKLPLAGGAITGNLSVNGTFTCGSYIVTVANVVYFSSTSGGYLQWNGGGTYTLGGGGTIWHSGNFTPGTGAITSMQLYLAGDHNHTNESYSEPFGGAVITGIGLGVPVAGTLVVRYRYLQVYLNGGWYTVSYAP
jgi:hypothetical protein